MAKLVSVLKRKVMAMGIWGRNWYGILLAPAGWLYGFGAALFHYRYNSGMRKGTRFTIPVIGVGNLAVGGTGKSPHIEYLIRLLSPTYQLAVLSRGYRRKSKGFVLADNHANAITIGDEPMQFYKKYGTKIKVAVSENRAIGIPMLLTEAESTQVILLDDAFQHRAVQPGLNILLTDYGRPFFTDFPMPHGRLREFRSGAKRADACVVSKCPDSLQPAEMQDLETKITKWLKPGTPVYFSGLKYNAPVCIYHSTEVLPTKVLGFAGLAIPTSFINKLKHDYQLLQFVPFPDHHPYTPHDLEGLITKAKELSGSEPVLLLTTEKDMVKLLEPEFKEALNGLPLYYLPLEVYFLKERARFDEMVIGLVEGTGWH